MTPKEYAKKLISLFEYKLMEDSKQYGLIIVEEIIDSLHIKNLSDVENYEYWNEVKHEIEKL
jgi:hypothetical protein